jgi:hypothetical protein
MVMPAVKPFEVACIDDPGFHPTPCMESRHGFGWSERDIARACTPRFPGHRQPILPAWGPDDERDPAWAAMAIDAAADAGIGVRIYDWYRDSGIEIRNEALDRGYLHAPDRSRMRFALMWANHTWQNNHPAPAGKPLADLLPIRHSPEDLDRGADAWCRRYRSRPASWRIDGRPWGHLVVNNTPERFGNLCADARAWIESRPHGPKAIVLNAWIEWTEGSAIAPSADQGTAVLDALRTALR